MIDHHYTECGLPNVIISGLHNEVDDGGDAIITIPAINELHRVIAEGIVRHDNGMSGDELRFLRTEMGLTQAELARLVHRDKQSIGRWERSEVELDSSAEVIIRMMAIEKLKLKVNLDVEEIALSTIPTVEEQPINIRAVAGDDPASTTTRYELEAA